MLAERELPFPSNRWRHLREFLTVLDRIIDFNYLLASTGSHPLNGEPSTSLAHDGGEVSKISDSTSDYDPSLRQT
jgi:hypothetical protein